MWETIKGIISVVTVLAVFSVASTNFETAVLVCLVFIYLSIGVHANSWNLGYTRLTRVLGSKSANIRTATKESHDGHEKDILERVSVGDLSEEEWTELGVIQKEEEKEKKLIREMDWAQYYSDKKVATQAIFQLIIFIIGIVKLLGALNIL